MKHAVAALLAAFVLIAAPARAERLIASLSSHRVQITSIFNGVELVLFGTVEPDTESVPRQGAYDIIATVTGPRQTEVTRRKARVFGIWINVESRTFVDVPAYLSVLATKPFAEITNEDALRRAQAPFHAIEAISIPWLDRVYAWCLRWIFKNNFRSNALTALAIPFPSRSNRMRGGACGLEFSQGSSTSCYVSRQLSLSSPVPSRFWCGTVPCHS